MKTDDPQLDALFTRIFLVEDNADHAFIALTILRQVLGDHLEVLHAQSADEAFDMITQFTEHDRPDLMLLDLRLPDHGGFAILSAARAQDELAEVPVFVITSSMYDRDIAESYQLGATAVLSKPLSRAKLRDELARVGAFTFGAQPRIPAYRH